MQAHLAAIAWIEAHLLEPMTVKSIADRARRIRAECESPGLRRGDCRS